jgi:hypothetical protein
MNCSACSSVRKNRSSRSGWVIIYSSSSAHAIKHPVQSGCTGFFAAGVNNFITPQRLRVVRILDL